jgi:hypothetical protein
MQLGTIITALIVAGIVWGGFIFFLFKAIKYEKVKLKNGKE